MKGFRNQEPETGIQYSGEFIKLMKNRAYKIIETILLLFFSVQCGRNIYERYAEFLSKRKIVPTFIIICAVLLFGTLFMLTLIWKNEWLTLPRKLKRHM